MSIHTPQGDLARAVTHEPNDEWPHSIEIRAMWKTAKGGNRYRSIHVDADAFFGRGNHGAPMSGDQVIHMIEQLRKQGPWK